MGKIKVKNQRGAKRELMRARRMQIKAWEMAARGDKRRGVELYRASVERCAEAEIYITANINEVDEELRDLLYVVLAAGVILEFELFEDE